jgi:hypothetical protein
VYLSKPGERGLKGPYLVASAPSAARYTLCDDAGNAVENGGEVDENQLSAC